MESQEPTPKILGQVRNLMRLYHYSIHTERSYPDWIKHRMIYTHVLQQGGQGVPSPLDDLRP